jgi:hypothetical protein
MNWSLVSMCSESNWVAYVYKGVEEGFEGASFKWREEFWSSILRTYCSKKKSSEDVDSIGKINKYTKIRTLSNLESTN